MYRLGIPLFLILVFLGACNSSSNSDSNPGTSSHVEPPIQTTIFTKHTEFYMVHPPIEVGIGTEILVHVTRLNDYRPYESGTLSLQVNNQFIKASQPERPGIFKLYLELKSPGELPAEYTLETESGKETIHTEIHVIENHNEAHQDDSETPEGEIQFLKEITWNADFMVMEVNPAPFASVVHTSGEIVPVPGMKKNIPAQVEGLLMFPNKEIVQGTRVLSGQHLFTLDGGSLTDGNVGVLYQEYKNSLNQSRSEYKRTEILYEQEVVAEKIFIESRTLYLNDSIRFYNLAARANEQGLKVYAPITGYIHELKVSDGQYVAKGELLATLSSNKVLLLRADMPQQYFNLLEDIESANFRPAYTDRTYSIDDFNGKILSKGSSVAENNHYLPVFFKVENDGTLLEGAYTEFYLKAREKKNRMVVPLSAVSEEQGIHYLYLQISGESYTKRVVTLGQNDGLFVDVVSGLNPGERVVTLGVMLLKAASASSEVPAHDHEH